MVSLLNFKVNVLILLNELLLSPSEGQNLRITVFNNETTMLDVGT